MSSIFYLRNKEVYSPKVSWRDWWEEEGEYGVRQGGTGAAKRRERRRREGELAGRYDPGERDKLTITGSREAAGVSSMNSWKQRWARAQGLEA